VVYSYNKTKELH